MKLIRTIIGSMAVAFGLTSVAVWAANEKSPTDKGSPTKGDTVKGDKGEKSSGKREPICGGVG